VRIADRLGVAYVETIHTWRRRYPDFPQPVAHLRRALIWSWPDVEAWANPHSQLGRLAAATSMVAFV
jgi:hypothetical protein